MGRRMYTPDTTPWQLQDHGKGIYSVSRYTMGTDGSIDLQDHGYAGRRYSLDHAQQVVAWESIQSA